ncbi:1-deoxy-D-xylulose-5-phosphate reductoisomerase [Catenovulum sp. 2E275]|uniref:1-deoxy-D-xylulose-5-phosphate reductoisomerase n=1 Tax=Catenovulum sp. 2E275 TaxID=2980497 RepID=UPI0021CFB5F4|nr:1-deoxy-D-xylulose-5-phosphate reductoisomerase [Catenovulum sp. 2E275]MCU4675738.1 1-deoxy-D-xylulose-5-phosphate reductoisomerase [Catenovulum sp. 2E275]
MKKLAVLGSTGSIGQSTLEVVRQNPDNFSVFALAAYSKVEIIFQQCLEFKPTYVVLIEPQAASELTQMLTLANSVTQVLVGASELDQLVAVAEIDVVVAAIVGGAGLSSTLAAARAGKTILLANKEALVMSGQIFIDQVKQNNAKLLPVDSEHNAIFQSLPLDYQTDYLQQQITDFGVHSIILTGSGGPFLNTPLTELATKTPAQACKHPNWSMGQKISVDSATMMNKGLELIEACWLFGVEPDFIEVLIHPQSVIHSMVRYIDGSIMAQLGAPDMKTPIAHCLGFPERIYSGSEHFDFVKAGQFEFQAPDFNRFPNLKLAQIAFKAGQEMTTVLNAANEIHVEAFLNNQIKFTQIAELNQTVMEKLQPNKATDLASIFAIDQEARAVATAGVAR